MALVAAFAAVDKLDVPKPTEVKDFTFIKPLTF
jgi:hypothetical protein